jgi:hypothetical protein
VFNHIYGWNKCLWLLLAVIALSGAACSKKSSVALSDEDPILGEPLVEASDYKLTGPFTHDNLTIYLILGEDKLQGKKLLTLEEALEQKKVVVYETQHVSELAIENTSDEDVFIQSGDIIKGGQQDRVIRSDLIVSAKAGRMPLGAFCVEHGRWSRRGDESADCFAYSVNALSTKDLKAANRRAKSQERVWKEVGRTQAKLGESVGTSVQSEASQSSLELSLEDKKVLEAAQPYIKQLAAITDEDDDVIGYAFAINGKVNSADVYASHDLFKRLWPKLLKSSAIEAVSELEKDKKVETPGADAVKAFLADAEKGGAIATAISERFTMIQQESENNLLFETRDKEANDVMLRRSYLAK